MTPAQFRKTALAVPGAEEGGHFGHADFRLGGKIFASLGYPDAGHAMVKLTRDQQEMVMAAEPEIFAPATGAWGRAGSTLVRLAKLDAATAKSALRMAAENLGKQKAVKKKTAKPRK